MLNITPSIKALRIKLGRIIYGNDFSFSAASLIDPVTGTAVAYAANGAINVTGVINSGDSQPQSQVLAADGAITIKGGIVFITKSSAANITLAAPTATTDDGKRLTIESTTAYAHVVVTPANKVNGADDTLTFGAAVGNSIELVAYQGVWYVVSTAKGVTLTEV